MEFKYWFKAEYLAGFQDVGGEQRPRPIWKECGARFVLSRFSSDLSKDPELLEQAYDWILTDKPSNHPLLRGIRIFNERNELVWSE